MKHRIIHPAFPFVAVLLCALAPSSPAQINPEQVPAGVDGVGIDQKLGAQIPLSAEFLDSDGRKVALSDFCNGKRPVILTLNYFTCPMLCHLQLQDLIVTLRGMEEPPGATYEVLTISFDPVDRPQLAKVKKDAYLAELGKPAAAAGWHFLTGSRESIRALTGSVGFRYRWNESEQEWAHSAAMILLSPNGKVTRYLGLNTDPKTLRLSLIEASEGKTGSFFDQLFLWCYHYDPAANQYAPVAMNIMRMGGVAAVVVLAVMLGGFWAMELRRRRQRRAVLA